MPLNALLRRLAALCFVGGLVLHCVFVPTRHSPSDWPSRGTPGTWPAELRRNRCAKGSARPSRLAVLEAKRTQASSFLTAHFQGWQFETSTASSVSSASSSTSADYF